MNEWFESIYQYHGFSNNGKNVKASFLCYMFVNQNVFVVVRRKYKFCFCGITDSEIWMNSEREERLQ